MRQLQLLFSKEVILEDSRKMKLDYSLTEKTATGDNQVLPYYGVNITKYLDNMIESEEVTGISHSRDIVVSMLKKLFRYEVTPISLVEIMDDLVTIEFS